MPVIAALGTYAIGTEAIAGEAIHGSPSLVINTPAQNELIHAAVTVTWTYTANPVTLWAQGYYRVKLLSGDRSLTFYDSGLLVGAAASAIIPITSFSDASVYQISVMVRPVAPGDTGLDDTTAYVTVSTDFSDVNVYPDVDTVGTVYEIGINGKGYMLADMTDAGVSASMATRRYARKTVALDSQRFATTSTPFSEAVDRYVFKNFSDFSGGAGQRYLDHEESNPTAYWDSENVNPFVPGKLTVNASIRARTGTGGGDSPGASQPISATLFNGSLYMAPWFHRKAIGSTATMSGGVGFIDVAAATDIYDITSSGQHWYAAAGAAGVFRNTVFVDPGAAWSAIQARVAEWVGDRLAVAYSTSGSTPNVFSTLAANGTEEVSGGRLVLPIGWSITSITSGGGKVWFTASTSTDRGAIYVWTIGTAAAPTIALEFPSGQRPTAVFAYQGNVFLRVAEWTNLASTFSKAYIYRCVPNADGTLTPTLVTTLGDSTSTVDQALGSFAGKGNFVYFTWKNMTTLGTTYGVGAIDLVGGGWCKWTYLSSTSLGGAPTNVGQLIAFGESLTWPIGEVASNTFWQMNDASTVNDGIQADGYLKTSLVDGNSNLLKVYDSLSTLGVLDTSTKTITVDWSVDLTTYTAFPDATLIGPNSSLEAVFAKRARSVGFKLNLVGFVSKTLTYLGAFTVKLHQLGLADQIITLPVFCTDELSNLNGGRIDADSGAGKGSAAARFLENLAQTRVKFQDKDWAYTRQSSTCEVISVDCNEVSVRSAKTGKLNEQIVAVMTLRRSLR